MNRFIFCISYIWPLAFMLAVALATTMVFQSQINAHPDEIHHITAAQYYTDHWYPPAVGDPASLNSYSKYGMSYLNEKEIVYFFAGKFARVLSWVGIPSALAIRLFNLLQFAGLCFLFWLKPSSRWALGLCLLSPQIWYIYSYFNGDAFPLTIGFGLAILFGRVTQTLGSSVKTLDISPRQLADIALFVIGLVILAISKRNYQVMLSFFIAASAYRIIGREAGLVFLMGAWLLALLFSFPSTLSINIQFIAITVGLLSLLLLLNLYIREIKSGNSLRFFASILSLSLLLGLTSIAPTAFEKLRPPSVQRLNTGDMVSKTAMNEFKPDQSGRVKFYGTGLRDKGVPFYQIMLRPWNWPELMSKSATGLYGWMRFQAPMWIYVMLWCSYSVLTIGAVRASRLSPQPETRDLGMMMAFSAAGLISAAAYSSWASDFQAQGRYLFPIIPMVATIAPAIAERMNAWWLTIAVGTAFSLSVISFITVGLAHIQ